MANFFKVKKYAFLGRGSVEMMWRSMAEFIKFVLSDVDLKEKKK